MYQGRAISLPVRSVGCRRPDHTPFLNSMEISISSFTNRICTIYEDDEVFSQVIPYLQSGVVPTLPRAAHQATNFTLENSFLMWTGDGDERLYIPEIYELRKGLMTEFHEPHFGAEKTYSLMMRKLYWKGMYDDIKRYCITCNSCQENNTPLWGVMYDDIKRYCVTCNSCQENNSPQCYSPGVIQFFMVMWVNSFIKWYTPLAFD